MQETEKNLSSFLSAIPCIYTSIWCLPSLMPDDLLCMSCDIGTKCRKAAPKTSLLIIKIINRQLLITTEF